MGPRVERNLMRFVGRMVGIGSGIYPRDFFCNRDYCFTGQPCTSEMEFDHPAGACYHHREDWGQNYISEMKSKAFR